MKNGSHDQLYCSCEKKKGCYLDLLVFDKSINDCDDEVFGKGKVCGTDTL